MTMFMIEQFATTYTYDTLHDFPQVVNKYVRNKVICSGIGEKN